MFSLVKNIFNFQLPASVGQLKNLYSINLSKNKRLKTLPDELVKCSHIWEVTKQYVFKKYNLFKAFEIQYEI